MWLSRLRLRGQLLAGFGSLVVLLVTIAAFGGYGLSASDSALKEMDDETAGLRNTQQMLFDSEMIRRAMTSYRFDFNQAALMDARAAETDVAAILADRVKRVRSPGRRALYEQAAEMIKVITARCDRFAALAEAANKYHTEMTVLGPLLLKSSEEVRALLGATDRAEQRALGIDI